MLRGKNKILMSYILFGGGGDEVMAVGKGWATPLCPWPATVWLQLLPSQLGPVEF